MYGSKLYEILLALIFACALYSIWSLQFLTGSDGALGGAGSDSFIIVNRIVHADSWPWYFQSYLSQIGGQGLVLAGLYKFLGEASVAYYSLIVANLFAFLTALSVSLAVPFLYRNSGIAGVLLVFVLFASSRWMFAFSHSIYWVLFTLIMPLTYSIAFGRMLDGSKRARLSFLVVLGFIIFIKCICGYEYISTITLLACAGYALSTVEGRRVVQLRSLVWIFVACFVGFAVAFIIHIVQLYIIQGGDGIQHIIIRILSYSGTDGVAGRPEILIGRLTREGGMEPEIELLSSDLSGHQFLFFWLSFKQYFSIDALTLLSVTVNFSLFSALGALAVARVGYVYYRYKSDAQSYPSDFPWALAAALALLAALSWQLLAWKHMTVHYHLNGLVFFIGLVPLASLWLLSVVRQTLGVPMAALDIRYVALGLAIVLSCVLLIDQKLTSLNEQARQFAGLAESNNVGVVRGSLDRLNIEVIPGGKTGIEITRGLGVPSSYVQAQGWAFSNVADTKVELRIKGETVRQIAPVGDRPDVKRVFPGATLQSGFSVSALVPSDVKAEDVEVWVIDQYGNRLELKKRG